MWHSVSANQNGAGWAEAGRKRSRKKRSTSTSDFLVVSGTVLCG